MEGSDGPGGGSGVPGAGSGGPGAGSGVEGELISWDNYKGSPMLELWTARTRNLEEPQVPD